MTTSGCSAAVALDAVYGGSGLDSYFYGGSGADSLFGGSGMERSFFGGDGDDSLSGGDAGR